MIIPGICQHPVYGTGRLISFNPETNTGHFIFPEPPGMVRDQEGVTPTADMELVDGKFVPLVFAE